MNARRSGSIDGSGRVRKRKADADLANERLSKRFESLKLERHVPPSLYAALERGQIPLPSPSPSPSPEHNPTLSQPTINNLNDESDMEVEDTPNRIYISNLAKEIAEIEAAERASQKPIFITDIDKALQKQSRIPMPVLANKDGEIGGVNRDQALVLYDFPRSLTVSEDKDSVRKAILEARHRAQQEQRRRHSVLDPDPGVGSVNGAVGLNSAAFAANGGAENGEPMAVEEDGDSDVMDLD